MQCERPISLSLDNTTKSVVRKAGRDGVVRSYPVSGRSGALVPCGKCFACLARRKSQATLRMDFERRFGHLVRKKDGTSECVKFKYSFFITLSYANEFLPYSWEFVDKRSGEYLVSLPKQDSPVLAPHHMTLFFKRLRRYTGMPFTYFVVGEYGSEDYTRRPHYHMIFYSDMNWTETKDAFRHAWSVECPKNRIGDPGTFSVNGVYTTYRLSMGRIDVKSVNMRRVRYCAKYIVKDGNDSDVVPKFARLSKGLGLAFIESYQARDIRKSKSLYAFSVDGKKCSLGRYFTHRLYTKDELSALVDDFVFKDSAPLDLEPGSIESTNWYREHIETKGLQYRAWKANQKNPLLIYL